MRDDNPESDHNEYRLVEAATAEDARDKLVANLEHIDTYGSTVYITDIEVSGVL